MEKLTKKEKWILEYLYETKKAFGNVFVSPTEIGCDYGISVLDNQYCHSSTASPACLSLVKKGKIIRNKKGHYKFLKF